MQPWGQPHCGAGGSVPSMVGGCVGPGWLSAQYLGFLPCKSCRNNGYSSEEIRAQPQNRSCHAQIHPELQPPGEMKASQAGLGRLLQNSAENKLQRWNTSPKKILIYCKFSFRLCCNSSVLHINKYTFVKKNNKQPPVSNLP